MKEQVCMYEPGKQEREEEKSKNEHIEQTTHNANQRKQFTE